MIFSLIIILLVAAVVVTLLNTLVPMRVGVRIVLNTIIGVCLLLYTFSVVGWLPNSSFRNLEYHPANTETTK